MNRIRVLIADPDASLLAAYRQHLEAAGLEVSTAASTLECVERLRQSLPNVLVLEPELPANRSHRDGVLALLSNPSEFPIVPTVMVLSNGSDGQPRPGDPTLRVREWHVKPMAPDVLTKRILNLVKEASHVGSHTTRR